MLDLIAWWNLPFTIPFALAVLYLLLTSFGLTAPGGDGELGVDADADVDADVGGADAGDDVSPSHPDYVGERLGGEQGSVRSTGVLDFLGLGRVPLTVIIQTFFLTWGFAGWAATSGLSRVLGAPLLFFWPAVLIAGLAAVIVTRLVARPLARWLPSTETYAVTKRQLLGRLGEVVLPVTVTAGTVHVRDDSGSLHQLACRVDNPDLVLAKGSEVILVAYEEAADRYLVVPSDLPPSPGVNAGE